MIDNRDKDKREGVNPESMSRAQKDANIIILATIG